MKLTTRQLAHRTEQKLETMIPKHAFNVSHTTTHGVAINVVFGGKVHEYVAGTSWTTCDMTIQRIARDYTAAKMREFSGD
jgi:hypothetical protein